MKETYKVVYERLLWFPHNAIAHPLMVFLPEAWGMWIHNMTIPTTSKLKENKFIPSNKKNIRTYK